MLLDNQQNKNNKAWLSSIWVCRSHEPHHNHTSSLPSGRLLAFDRKMPAGCRWQSISLLFSIQHHRYPAITFSFHPDDKGSLPTFVDNITHTQRELNPAVLPESEKSSLSHPIPAIRWLPFFHLILFDFSSHHPIPASESIEMMLEVVGQREVGEKSMRYAFNWYPAMCAN